MLIKRVLLAINVRWWNAEAAYALNLARGLKNQGIQVWLIVNLNSPVHQKARERGLEVITDVALDSYNPVVQLKNLKRLFFHIDHKGIQLINSFKSNGAFLFSIVRYFRLGIIYIKTRGVASPPRNNIFNRYLYGSKCCDGIVTVGSPVRRWMEGLFGGNRLQNITTVHYGDTPVSQNTESNRESSRTRHNIPEEAFVLTLLGRTQQIKGHLILLEALKLIDDPVFHLLFLIKDKGEYPDELNKIEQFIKSNNLNKQVTMLGFQDDLGGILSTVDCGVIPSTASEVNCRVCVEFFSLGIPVVSFPTGTLPDIVEHKKNGYLCAEKTAMELVRAIKWIYGNRDEFIKMGEKALKDYQEKYTLEAFTSNMLAFYETCSNRDSEVNRVKKPV
ncbi:glycosyltransferase family 4 protein [bacterium]|nr:glycosyltransferase family 4 protein [bacterium]